MADKKVYSIQIDGIKQSVEGVDNLGKAVNANADNMKQLKQALKETKNEMVGLEKYSDEWNQLAKKAGDYKDQIDDINQATRRWASDTKALDDVLNLGQSMVSVFTLAKGTMNAFGLETEGAVEAIQKLQGAMAIIQSIQTLQNTLRGSTATTDLLSKAMKACTVSIEGTTTATKALKVALASIGIGLVIIAITELITHWEDLKEIIGLTTKEQEKANETFETGIAAYAKAKAELTSYITKLETFNGTKEQEKQLVEECNKKYGEAFGHYETLAQWKDVLKQKTEAYCRTLMLEAQMQAKVNQLTKAYEKVANAKKEWDRVKEGDRTFWEQIKDFFNPGGTFDNARDDFNDARKGVRELEDEIEELAKQIAENNMENGLFQTVITGKDGKGGKKAVDEAKKQLEQLKKIYEDWRKAERKSEEELKNYKKKLDEEELKNKEKLADANRKSIEADYKIEKAALELAIEEASTDEDKIKLKKKLIELEAEHQKYLLKLQTMDELGVSEEEFDQMLSGVKVLTDYQAQVISNMQKGVEVINLALEKQKNELKPKDDKGDKGDKGGSSSGGNRFKDYTPFGEGGIDLGEIGDIISDAYEAYAAPIVEGLGDSIHMMLEFAIEEAENALEEAEEMHDEAVDKVSESKDKLSELNDKMRDSSGAQLEAYKQQMADEVLLLQQREQEERRLQKEKEKREKELEKQKKKQRKLELQQQLVQAIVSGALAVVNGLATQPFFPVGIAMGALAGVAAAIQIATITQQMSKLADGGLLQGKSHAEGGIPVGNTGIEVEGGEYVVNKRSTAKYLPLLQQINEEGARKKTVANQIGKMADGGELNYERINSNMDAINTAKIVSTAIEGIEMHPVVSVVDINRGQRNYTEVRQLAGANE